MPRQPCINPERAAVCTPCSRDAGQQAACSNAWTEHRSTPVSVPKATISVVPGGRGVARRGVAARRGWVATGTRGWGPWASRGATGAVAADLLVPGGDARAPLRASLTLAAVIIAATVPAGRLSDGRQQLQVAGQSCIPACHEYVRSQPCTSMLVAAELGGIQRCVRQWRLPQYEGGVGVGLVPATLPAARPVARPVAAVPLCIPPVTQSSCGSRTSQTTGAAAESACILMTWPARYAGLRRPGPSVAACPAS